MRKEFDEGSTEHLQQGELPLGHHHEHPFADSELDKRYHEAMEKHMDEAMDMIKYPRLKSVK
jgi:hypothetical protein